jgi:hypothetical protein
MIDINQPPVMYGLAFASSFLFTFAKSFQQNNVTHKVYKWIIPTSLFLALMEVYTISVLSKYGVGWLVLIVGLGSGLGSSLSVFVHEKFIMKREHG